jgi:hypothetical protein
LICNIDRKKDEYFEFEGQIKKFVEGGDKFFPCTGEGVRKGWYFNFIVIEGIKI